MTLASQCSFTVLHNFRNFHVRNFCNWCFAVFREYEFRKVPKIPFSQYSSTFVLQDTQGFRTYDFCKVSQFSVSQEFANAIFVSKVQVRNLSTQHGSAPVPRRDWAVTPYGRPLPVASPQDLRLRVIVP